jgi:hypothetical protein
MSFSLKLLHSNLGQLNSQLEVLDNKLSRLEITSDNDLFEIFLLANQLNISFSESLEYA